ncbi:hypothetical protein SAV14893_082910 [Streptomyces avermitilis]|uniref:Uncharacterized protein n=1 Tax=Streptomyces avermitilis TaxID=33903 RepID=A0A4D4MFF9_STRAX|nr:hypothetical protein [Streptomyces avermitilis]GDY68898.1 hypothetical protein SAV14893_082910 [Streptomyces avermitilis]GDY70718.1 hypothetical protein SAV31267_002030 [Streptomyces avermitilis]
MAAGGSTAAALGAYIAFEDEAGFAMTPPRGHTWGRRGQAPVVRVRGPSRQRRARPSHDENEQRVVLRLSRARKAPRDLALRARMVELSWARQQVLAVAAS